VRILYKDNGSEEPVEFREMAQLGCHNRTLCPLETFMEVTERNAVADIRKECQIGKGKLEPMFGQICLNVKESVSKLNIIKPGDQRLS
jgi:hypothetical protein